MRWALAGILVVLMAGIAVAGFAVARRPASDDTACATRVAPGGDVSKAIFEAPAGGTVCLEAGVFAPFRVARPRAGVTVRGAGTDLTAVHRTGAS